MPSERTTLEFFSVQMVIKEAAMLASEPQRSLRTPEWGWAVSP